MNWLHRIYSLHNWYFLMSTIGLQHRDQHLHWNQCLPLQLKRGRNLLIPSLLKWKRANEAWTKKNLKNPSLSFCLTTEQWSGWFGLLLFQRKTLTLLGDKTSFQPLTRVEPHYSASNRENLPYFLQFLRLNPADHFMFPWSHVPTSLHQ